MVVRGDRSSAGASDAGPTENNASSTDSATDVNGGDTDHADAANPRTSPRAGAAGARLAAIVRRLRLRRTAESGTASGGTDLERGRDLGTRVVFERGHEVVNIEDSDDNFEFDEELGIRSPADHAR